jgi:hypothetical protein
VLVLEHLLVMLLVSLLDLWLTLVHELVMVKARLWLGNRLDLRLVLELEHLLVMWLVIELV